MRRSDSGAGNRKAIVTLAILVAIGYVAIKTIPVYVHNYELQDYIRELAIRATVAHAKADTVRDDIVAYGRDLDLPLNRDNVKVQAGSKVTISIDYTVPINLKVYTLNLHFSDSAENRSII
jgi:hypothetical protein